MADSTVQTEVVTTGDLPQGPRNGLLNGLLRIEAADLIFYGALVFATHVVLLIANQLLVYRALSRHIPSEFSSGYAVTSYASLAAGAIGEAAFFLLGWLFICGMATLLDGQSNSRMLFGGLAACYALAAMASLATFLFFMLTLDRASYASISQARTEDEFSAAINAFFASSYYSQTAIWQNIGYGALILLAVEMVHRVCRLRRWKAAAILSVYVALLAAVNRLAG